MENRVGDNVPGSKRTSGIALFVARISVGPAGLTRVFLG